MKRKSPATIIVIGIIILLAIIVLYQQYSISQRTTGIKSVREEATQDSGINMALVNSGMNDLEPTITANEVTGGILTGVATITGNTATGTTNQIIPTDGGCVTSYQSLVDRAYGGRSNEADATQGLVQQVGLGYCNGSTPNESDFLNVQSNGQTISYTSASGGTLDIGGSTVNPDFTQECDGTCPQVQAIRLVRPDNKYVVLETTQPRDYQSSFRLVSTTNGVTMLFWSVLNYVDPLVSYAWSSDGHFVFIASSGRETHTYIVQPKGFPTNTQITSETDTPIAVSIAGTKVIVLYDRDATNTSTTDRYTKSYAIADLGVASEIGNTASF